MTQDELWLAKWQEVIDFMETYHRNPSKHRIEEHLMLNWIKHNRKLMNAGEIWKNRSIPTHSNQLQPFSFMAETGLKTP